MTETTKVIWPNYSEYNLNNIERQPTTTLGKDEFLTILIAQLQNQDPMSPLEDQDFIAQMAQFTSVEQIMNMSTEMELLRQSMGISSDLIGKSIQYSYTNESTYEEELNSGIVEGIKMLDGLQYVIVNGEEIGLDQILKIWNTEQESEQVEEISQDSTDDESPSEETDTNASEGSDGSV